MLVMALLIQIVCALVPAEEVKVIVLFGVTVAAPVATFCVVAPVEETVTLPLAPLIAVLLNLTHIVVLDTVPELGLSVTLEP